MSTALHYTVYKGIKSNGKCLKHFSQKDTPCGFIISKIFYVDITLPKLFSLKKLMYIIQFLSLWHINRYVFHFIDSL